MKKGMLLGLLLSIIFSNSIYAKTKSTGQTHLIDAHTYFIAGKYYEASEANLQAIATYHQYIKKYEAQGLTPPIDYAYFHNYDFLRTSASMEGRKELALRAAKQMLEDPFAKWLRHEPPLQKFIPIPLFVEARFNLWRDILKEPAPLPKYGYALGMWHYARGMAFAHLNKINTAEAESRALKTILQKSKPDSILGKAGKTLLTIADHVLLANISDAKHDQKNTLFHLKTAMRIQDSMGYQEPPDWYLPLRQARGDAYLKWHHPNEAIVMYSQDLKQYPKNGWSLLGLEKSYRALGNETKADKLHKQYEDAWRYAD